MIVSRLKYIYLAYFSRPQADRTLFRSIRRHRTSRILQLGMATPNRALRLIEVARRGSAAAGIRFVAVDLFEARPDDQPGIALKDAYRSLKPTGAQVQLIPGDVESALARSANALGQMDLILITAEHEERSLGGAWFYVPRMLHASSLVYVESRVPNADTTIWRLMTPAEIESLAAVRRPRRAA